MSRFGPWLVSPRFDLSIFLVPAVVALLLVPVGPVFDGELPLPMWVLAVLVIDVAHVYATLFITYLSPEGRVRYRRWLIAAPVAAAAIGSTAMAVSSAAFWTVLAYVAVFHFVRQQYGWVVLYQRKQPELSRIERAIDRAAIYTATLFPLLWWHANLPRHYAWFLPGDFIAVSLEPRLLRLAAAFYAVIFFGFLGIQLRRFLVGRAVSLGKVSVVLGTYACWGIGIVVTNSDWAFTVTNVIIHGVPYTAFVWHRCGGRALGRSLELVPFAAALVLLAYVEEWAWDRTVWHEAASIFPGPEIALAGSLQAVVIVVLAIPQFTHYILDGFIWRRSSAGPP